MAATVFRSVKDKAVGLLAVQLDAAAVTLTLDPGQGALFPDVTGPDNPFILTIDNEHLLCTARVVDVLTITRAQEGTADVTHSIGVAVEMRVVSSIISSMHTAINEIEDGTKVLDSVTATGIITSTSGGLFGGVVDITSGLLTLFGGLTGDEGGEIRLYTTVDNQGDFDFWSIDIQTDDMRFFQSTGEQVLLLVGHATTPHLRVITRLEIDGDLDHDGTNVGFYATAPASQQTISTARDNPEGALADLLTALDLIGLIVDSSSAS